MIYALLLVFSWFCITTVSRTIAPFDPDSDCCDHLFYRAMAGGPRQIPEGNRLITVYDHPYHGGYLQRANGLTHQPPYVYRPLAPLLSRLLGFRTLSLISLVLAAWLLGMGAFILTTHATLGALTIVLFASCPWLTGYYLRHYQAVDPLAFVFVGLVVVLVCVGKHAHALGVIALGLFAKEPVGLLLPCVLLAARAAGHLNWRLVAMAGLAIVPYAAFRILTPIPQNTYSLAATFMPWPPFELWIMLRDTWGLYWLAPVLAWRSPLLRSLLPMVLLSAGLSLFASNVERCAIYAYPAVYLSLCFALSRCAQIITTPPNIAAPGRG
jgi:hypothetical protein